MGETNERTNTMRTDAQTATAEDEMEIAVFEKRDAEQRRKARKEARRRNRERQRTGHPDRAQWRAAPATAEQINALRVIATASGKTFKDTITRGEAWRRIREATKLLDETVRKACAPPWCTQPHRCNPTAR